MSLEALLGTPVAFDARIHEVRGQSGQQRSAALLRDLLAESEDSSYVAYVSQQNLLDDGDSGPIDHPNVPQLFEDFMGGRYRLRRSLTH